MVSLWPLMTFTVGESVSQWPEMMRIAVGTAWNTLDRHDFRNHLAGKLSSIDSVGDPCDKKNVSISFPLIDRIRQPTKLRPNETRGFMIQRKANLFVARKRWPGEPSFIRSRRRSSHAPARWLDEPIAKMRDPHVVGRSERVWTIRRSRPLVWFGGSYFLAKNRI